MKRVFATSYNVKTALSYADIDFVSINQVIIKDIILAKDLCLSSKDLNSLKALHLFLDSPNGFISKYFKGWKDNVKFLIEEPPAYHFNRQCEWLQKDFYNVEIPSKIRDNNLIADARSWAKVNRSLMQPKTIETFRSLFVNHFNDTYEIELTCEDLKSIERPNSGKQLVNISIEDIEAEIKKILSLIDSRFSRKHQDFFDREYKEKNYQYGGEYQSNGAYIELKLYWDLQFWTYSIVKPLIKNLEDYIFLKLNQNQMYEQNVLDFLKFVPCRAKDCKK